MLGKLTIVAGVLATVVLAQEEAPDHRLQASADVLRKITSVPDRSPSDLLSRAKCVVVVPGVKKGAVGVGGEYGRGFAICRHDGSWGGPAAIKLSGGSVGPQIGVESTDVVLLVMNQKGMERLEKDKLTLGTDASVAAGPVGKTAAADTDISLRAEILSYSHSHGVFAGLALDGTVLSRDNAEDRKLYGREVSNGEVIRGEVPAPPSASVLTSSLDESARPRR
jgi:lipid-binding SYLF domain-containing protein